MLHVEHVYATQMLLQKQERKQKWQFHQIYKRRRSDARKIKQALRGCQAPDLTH